ncbi:MAG: hypothetical protein M3Z08_19320 [Chloroflexota bacterium]|nr:hypothetical protein [Chloroflexota bacterium]
MLFIFVFVLAAIPAYTYGMRAGAHIVPAVTNFFSTLGAPASPVPTPHPALPTVLPQAGSLLYTVQGGESCDEMLTLRMHMNDAGEVFSDVKPATVSALSAAIGKDCHALQPGMTVMLSPQYPLVALAGLVRKVEATAPLEVLPTPLINVAQQQQGPDCSSGCLLTIQIAPAVQIKLQVQTALTVQVGSWVWAQAMYPRKAVPNFYTYPYADPGASLNGVTLRACDFQVDGTHDDNSLSCDQLQPNSIDLDGGAWLFGVTGSDSLDHWGYALHLPAGTRVLLWLTVDNNGNLHFRKHNAVYRYDDGTHLYVRT